MAKRRAQAGDPSVAVAYIRVSTDEQKLGPAAQRETIASWALKVGKRVVSWHADEGVSGGSDIDDRPGLLKALEAVRTHRAGVLVVAKRDRIARDMFVAVTIERVVAGAGAQLLSADGTGNGEEPADQFMRRVLDGASEYERALIRARTRAALAAKKQQGGRTGSCPFGFKDDGTGQLVKDTEEQCTIALALELRGQGMTERAIASELGQQGRTSRSGKPLGQVQVHRILTAARGGVRVEDDAPDERELLLFHRRDQAVTLGWVLQQVAALEERGLSRKQAVQALQRIGVTKHGRRIKEGDL